MAQTKLSKEIIVFAPLLLPRFGLRLWARENVSFIAPFAASFTSGKSNGVVAANVMRHLRRQQFIPENHQMRNDHFLLITLLILLLLVPTHALSQQTSITYDHVIPGYLFDVYENDTIIPKKAWLWIDANKTTQTITCKLIYLLVQEENQSISLEAHHYSNTDGTILNIEIDSKRISFDLSLSWLVPGRTIRVACDGSTPKYTVRALGLWRHIDGSGTTKIEWKPIPEIKLPYSRIVSTWRE